LFFVNACCTAIECDGSSLPSFTGAESVVPRTGLFPYAATISYSCPTGYRFEDGNTDIVVTCTGVGFWDWNSIVTSCGCKFKNVLIRYELNEARPGKFSFCPVVHRAESGTVWEWDAGVPYRKFLGRLETTYRHVFSEKHHTGMSQGQCGSQCMEMRCRRERDFQRRTDQTRFVGRALRFARHSLAHSAPQDSLA